MKIIAYCFLSLVACSISLAQVSTFNKEAELQKFVEQGGKYEETAPNIYKLTYRTGETRVFNFNPTPKQTNFAANSDTTIINVWEIDTLLYYQKFSFWQKVNVVNDFEGRVFVDDINNNGKLELYGLTRVNWPLGGQVDILEQNGLGIFDAVFSYDSTSLFVQGIGDIDSDGRKEVHIKSIDIANGKFYKSDGLNTLPTTFDLIFYYTPFSQINDMYFGEFDNNKITDCVFIDGAGTHKCVIAEYVDSINNFKQVFQFEGSDPGDFSGFAIGDFDQDKKTEIVFGATLKKFFVIEVDTINRYSLIWQQPAVTYNAYLVTKTNDIDKNGRDEFWVGGQDFNEGISKIMGYESVGGNNYVPVAYIEFKYLVSFNTNYIQSDDINNDGVEELIINLGDYLIILEFAGEPNQHIYKIFYAKIKEGTQIGAHFQPCTIHDLNNDGKKDILIPMDKYVNPNTIIFSYLLKQNSIPMINEDNIKSLLNFNIEQNYPNPFNSISQIKFFINAYSKINIKVFSSLGKEIRTLLDKNLSTGEYTIEWDGKDSMGNIQTSGVYFIRMEANGLNKTIKTILLK